MQRSTQSRFGFILALLFALAMVAAACGTSVSEAPLGADPIPVEPDGGIGDTPEGDVPISVEPDGGIGNTPNNEVPFFGGNDTFCESTTLGNEPDDQQKLADGVDCFFAEYEAGNSVIWDASIPTVEGDPIYHRFAYDGEAVVIVIDSRLDSFGSGSVDARTCASIERTNWIPEGVDCGPIDHAGFAEAS